MTEKKDCRCADRQTKATNRAMKDLEAECRKRGRKWGNGRGSCRCLEATRERERDGIRGINFGERSHTF